MVAQRVSGLSARDPSCAAIRHPVWSKRHRESSPIQLLYAARKIRGFSMRGQVVMLAATLAWFVNIKAAEAKLDILVDKAKQRVPATQDGYIRYMWPVSTGRDSMQTPNGVYAPQRLERNWF